MKHVDINELVIREAVAGDTENIADIIDEAFSTLHSIYRPIGDALAHQSERYQAGVRLVCLWHGTVIGTVQYVEHKNHIHLIGLAISPEFQRQGAAHRLVGRVCDLAPDLGYGIVNLDTIRETGNVEIFKKMGFYVVREIVADWCISEDYPCVHEVIMQRLVRSTCGQQ